ncbi:MAG TPA: chloride channel protein [Solirubrobacterales bacterium]|nr:chloride channel protein [Solirubrobacterales bacterium]
MLAAGVGIVVSLTAWAFLELIHQVQVWVFTDLPSDLGYDRAPDWLYVVVLAIAGLISALAIVRLPGQGGHVPAEGLKVGGAPVEPIELPGVLLAAFASISLGIVIGPEAPLIAMGAGMGVLAMRAVRRGAPAEVQAVMGASGSIAAVSLLFGSPIIAAVLLLEALGLDRQKLPLILLPGLLAAGIGSLISIGIGSITGLNTSDYSIGAVTLPTLATPVLPDFLWTIPLAAAIAVLCFVVTRLGLLTYSFVRGRELILLPIAGVAIALLAIAFHATSGKSAEEVLFSGQDALPGLTAEAGTWSISALLLVIGFKGLAWGLSLGGFRGGPTFPAMFIGAAAGILASHLPGLDVTAGVGVGIGAGVVSMLRLPLTAVVLGVLLTDQSGPGTQPVIIVGVVVAYLVTVVLGKTFGGEPEGGEALPQPG